MVLHLINILAGAGIGNKTKLSQENVNDIIQKSKELYETGQVNNSVIELVKSTISKTLVANQSNISNVLKAENTIKIGNTQDMTSADKIELAKICGATEYNFGKVDQVTSVNYNSANEVKNSTKVDIKEEVEKSVKQSMNSLATEENTSNSGTAFGNIAETVVDGLASVGKEAMGVLKSAGGGAGIGNKFEQKLVNKNMTDISNELTKTNIDTSDFKDMEDMSLEDELSQENITAIVNEVLASNKFEVDDPCISSFNLDEINQFNKVAMKIESKTLNDVSKSIANKYIKNIEFVMDKIESSKTTNNSGDIAALGGAVAGTLTAGGKAISGVVDSAGDATSKVIDSTGDASSKVIDSAGDAGSKVIDSSGKAVKTAATGIGSAISSFIWPLAIVVVVAIIIYLMWKFGGLSAVGSLFSKSDSGDDEDDAEWEDEDDFDEGFDRKYLSYNML